MKDWIIIYVDYNAPALITVKADNAMAAIYISALPLEQIVSVQCVNTSAPV